MLVFTGNVGTIYGVMIPRLLYIGAMRLASLKASRSVSFYGHLNHVLHCMLQIVRICLLC
jgi:hypothetical protein